jgi:putative hydrolase of the HAD superfamily
MCLNPSRVVVLDVDDTLYLECNYVKSGFRAVGEIVQHAFGCTGFEAECIRLFTHGVRGNIFNAALENLDLPTDSTQVMHLVNVYREHAPSIGLLDDARDLLDVCVGNVELAVISDGPFVAQKQKVVALGLEAWTNHIVLTDQWGREYWKPHQRAFSHIETVFHASGSECVYIADNPHKDFQAPQSLGWQTVRIRRPGSLHEHVRLDSQCRVNLEVTNLGDVGHALHFSEGIAGR